LGIHRSGLFYKPRPVRPQTLLVMRLIDEQYTRTPFYGSRRMVAWLLTQGQTVNRKRVVGLMQKMGLGAIYPRPRLSTPAPGQRIYPYLLRCVKVERVDQVWSTDITYIRLPQGFIYLTAVIDWFSRYVLSWEVSTTLDAAFCVSALERALSGGRPEIFNTDQGSQFTSAEFTGCLSAAGVSISMDGRGRALDNIFVERLWRSVKYEEVYLKEYANVPEAIGSLGAYLRFYNEERLHQSLGYRTPAAIYYKETTKSEDINQAGTGFHLK
jgi:putative transposase